MNGLSLQQHIALKSLFQCEFPDMRALITVGNSVVLLTSRQDKLWCITQFVHSDVPIDTILKNSCVMHVEYFDVHI